MDGDPGPIVMLLALAAGGLIASIPKDTMKALGGALIIVTVVIIVMDAVRLLSG